MIERKCENCGKLFLKRKSSLMVTKHDFCSRKCCYEYRRFQSTNEFILHEDFCEIIIKSKTFGTHKVLIDLDDVDKCKSYSWVLSQHDNTFYVVARDSGKNKNIYLHHLIVGCSEQKYIDHIDRNTLNNQSNNLRICTPTENNYNRMSNRSSTGYKYISIDKKSNKFRVYLSKSKKQIHIGYFDTLADALSARDKAISNFEFKQFINI